jgi:hypothetical protein
MKVALFLGAGFSHPAGLPLTSQLFDTCPMPRTAAAGPRYEAVRQSFAHWSREHPGEGAERWLLALYGAPGTQGLEAFTHGVSWEDAIEFALARLVLLRDTPGHIYSKAPYYHDVFLSIKGSTHRKFWKRVLETFENVSVVTTNYDILIEQGLKDRYSSHRDVPPLFYYGGLPMPQVLRKMIDAQRASGKAEADFEEVALGTRVPLFKLHGSLNWVFEPHRMSMKVHADVRAVYREHRDLGTPEVVPPLPEKAAREWMSEIWRQAEIALAEAQLWFVCGYSLLQQDQEVRELLTRAARKAFGLGIVVSDPQAESVVERLRALLPSVAEIRALPKLEDVIVEDQWRRVIGG